MCAHWNEYSYFPHCICICLLCEIFDKCYILLYNFFSVIGDEILKGQVQDTNSYFMCQRLFSLGAKVKMVNIDEIIVILNLFYFIQLIHMIEN